MTETKRPTDNDVERFAFRLFALAGEASLNKPPRPCGPPPSDAELEPWRTHWIAQVKENAEAWREHARRWLVDFARSIPIDVVLGDVREGGRTE